MSGKELKEEVVRMIRFGDSIYFHQADVCKILELINAGCESLNAKAKLTQALSVFSCIVDPLNENPE